jgi:hypothetical protein
MVKIKTSFILNNLKACLHNIPRNMEASGHLYVVIPVDSNFLQEHVMVLSTILNTIVTPQFECICVTRNVHIRPSICNNLYENEN